jgi:hypothetical protein
MCHGLNHKEKNGTKAPTMVGRTENNRTSLLELLTTEPITNYCNAATDLNNLLEEIAKHQASDGAAATTTTTRQDCEQMLPGKIRRLRNATRDLQNHLTRLDEMAATAVNATEKSAVREHAERTRRAVASIVQGGSAGGRFHSNGIPHEPSAMNRNVNVNLIAISTVRASIARLKEKIIES